MQEHEANHTKGPPPRGFVCPHPGCDFASKTSSTEVWDHAEAEHPGIERDGVAKALKAAGKERASELFLTTKIKKPPKGTAPADAAELVFKQIKEDFKVLNVNNVDMLMLSCRYATCEPGRKVSHGREHRELHHHPHHQ